MSKFYKIKFHATWNPYFDKEIISREDYRTAEEFKLIFNNSENIYNNFLQITHNEDYDFLVCINIPRPDYIDKIDFKKTIMVYSEPKLVLKYWSEYWYKNEYWIQPPDNNFFRVFDTERHHSIVYPFVRYNDCSNIKKCVDSLTCILTKSYSFIGHIDRYDFLNKYLYKYDDLICFILNINESMYNEFLSEKKFKNIILTDLLMYSVYNYKYFFNSENCYQPGYITEKLISPIYSNTLTFYNGPDNVCDIIDPIFYIKIDLRGEENRLKSYDTIKKAIRDKEWEKRIDIMDKRKHLIYKKFNIFNIIEKIIKER